MAIKCTNGGTTHSHESVDEVRLCWSGTVMDKLSGTTTTINQPSTKQVTYALDLLAHRVWPDEFTEEDLKGMERRQVSELINGLLKAKRKNLEKGASGPKGPNVSEKWDDIPAGRYALAFRAGMGPEPEWRFFQVDKPEEGRWAGCVFVKQLIGAPGAYREQKQSREVSAKLLKLIRERTARQASIDYGLKSETCGVCSSPLSNDESLKLGIGPKCRKKMGW